MENLFTNIYKSGLWGNNNNPDYVGSSGPGSRIEYNKDRYIPFLKKFITDKNISSVVDLGCGDFLCGKEIYDSLSVTYTGYDIYEDLVKSNKKNYKFPKYNFIHLDVCNQKEKITSADLCIVKDVLQHWSNQSIYKFMDYLINSKKFKYILIINCCNDANDEGDTNDGGWRSLSCDYYPLRKYKPTKLGNYNTKEVSLITIE